MKIFREELAKMGFKFQFITLAGWHALNNSMFEIATQLQEREFGNEVLGYRATRHQSFVGTGYFDAVQETITQGKASTTALHGSTEAEQFEEVELSH